MPGTIELARRLPDIPRWIEARDLLLTGSGEIYGLEEEPELSFVVRDPETDLWVVVGTPSVEAIRYASRGTVIAPLDTRDLIARALPDWHGTRAVLHVLGESPRLSPSDERVRLLHPEELDLLSVSPQLMFELKLAIEWSPVAATFVEERPVSFCYAGSITETLWDISIETLEGFRRRGYAELCVSFMIRHMDFKRPVWGAVVENPASWRLARKLGLPFAFTAKLTVKCSSGRAERNLPSLRGRSVTSSSPRIVGGCKPRHQALVIV